ncbi:outer membrane beta-barrel protein [Tenacibaculum tangerinum]|uniref:Outer membrane beta-barrel protein n=1 Tax=Tenacibaculum tangerinum TaxID=3038772 RepID=A0ABY8L2L4_9FLAO|nr:outer membrane beta-barrel protein [Tenacibaculum tangerinum]WGH75686.1 outer membrane beta-barrel protein [Tenacibaculum tangerinum]
MRSFLCIGLFFISSLSIGQIREKGTIELTPIIGYSASYHIHSFVFASPPVPGIQLGVYGNYFLNERWSLRSGLLYQKMGTEKIDFSILKDDYSEKTNYITLPVTINYHFGGKRNWYANNGIFMGILTSAEANYNDGNGFVDIKDTTNPIQIGISNGIGYKFKISPKFIVAIDNSNMVGLTKTNKERIGVNFYVSLNLGVVFKI